MVAVLTFADAIARGGCFPGVDLMRQKCGDPFYVNEEDCAAACDVDWVWYAENYLTPAGFAEFERRRRAALAKCRTVQRDAYSLFRQQTEPDRQKYRAIIDPMAGKSGCDVFVIPYRTVLDVACAPYQRDLDAALEASERQYLRDRAAAFAQVYLGR